MSRDKKRAITQQAVCVCICRPAFEAYVVQRLHQFGRSLLLGDWPQRSTRENRRSFERHAELRNVGDQRPCNQGGAALCPDGDNILVTADNVGPLVCLNLTCQALLLQVYPKLIPNKVATFVEQAGDLTFWNLLGK